MPKLCFAFLTQNSSTYLQRNINWIRACAQQYDDYRIVFVENDSTDNTVDILNATIQSDPYFNGEMMIDNIGTSEALCTRGYNCPRRLQRLAVLRQQLLTLALAWDKSDYIIMLDADFIRIDSNELHNAIQYMDNDTGIEGAFGVSMLPGGQLYDTFAIRDTVALVRIVLGLERTIPVQSAFSGVGIYRSSSIRARGARYDALVQECEHVHFNSYFRRLVVLTNFRPVYNTEYMPANLAEVLYLVVCPCVIVTILWFCIKQ